MMRREIRQATAADAAIISGIYAKSWKAAFRGQLPDGYLDQLPADHWTVFFTTVLTEGSQSAKLIYDKKQAVGAIAYGAARMELPVGGMLTGDGRD